MRDFAHLCLLHSSLSSSQLTAPTLTTPFSESDSFTHFGASCWQCPHLQKRDGDQDMDYMGVQDGSERGTHTRHLAAWL